MTHECTEALFLRDVAQHKMAIIRDDGVHRHVQFKQVGSRNMCFDLITWPGHLCYTGDMGTYVFQRTTDMFQFFRCQDNRYRINLSYWAEKIEASPSRGVREFSFAKFQAMIRDWVNERAECDKPDDEDTSLAGKHAAAYAELRTAIEDEVVNCDDNETRCYDAASDFRHDGEAWQEFYGSNSRFEFSDLWDGFDFATKEYTFHFVWCCYALAWGIEQYDAAKAEVPAVEAVPA